MARKLKLTHIKNFRIFAALLLLLFLLSPANAQLMVDLSPAGAEEGIPSVYPEETIGYTLTLFNASAASLENLRFKILPDEGLLVLDWWAEEKEKFLTIEELKAGETKKINFLFKPAAKTDGQYNISAYYGKEEFTKVSSTFLRVLPNPVEITAKLEKESTEAGQENRIVLSLKNNSTSDIKNISAELLLPENVHPISDKIFIESLPAGKESNDNALEFKIEPQVDFDKIIMLKISYAEGAKTLNFQKNFTVKIENRSFALYIIVAIAAIIVLFFAARKFLGPKTPKLQAVEIKKEAPPEYGKETPEEEEEGLEEDIEEELGDEEPEK